MVDAAVVTSPSPSIRSSIGLLSDRTSALKRRTPSSRARCGEPVEQGRGDAAVVPRVGHRHGDLGPLAIRWRSHEARHSDAVPARGLDGHERLVVVVVDRGQVISAAALSPAVGVRKRR